MLDRQFLKTQKELTQISRYFTVIIAGIALLGLVIVSPSVLQGQNNQQSPKPIHLDLIVPEEEPIPLDLTTNDSPNENAETDQTRQSALTAKTAVEEKGNENSDQNSASDTTSLLRNKLVNAIDKDRTTSSSAAELNPSAPVFRKPVSQRVKNELQRENAGRKLPPKPISIKIELDDNELEDIDEPTFPASVIVKKTESEIDGKRTESPIKVADQKTGTEKTATVVISGNSSKYKSPEIPTENSMGQAAEKELAEIQPPLSLVDPNKPQATPIETETAPELELPDLSSDSTPDLDSDLASNLTPEMAQDSSLNDKSDSTTPEPNKKQDIPVNSNDNNSISLPNGADTKLSTEQEKSTSGLSLTERLQSLSRSEDLENAPAVSEMVSPVLEDQNREISNSKTDSESLITAESSKIDPATPEIAATPNAVAANAAQQTANQGSVDISDATLEKPLITDSKEPSPQPLDAPSLPNLDSAEQLSRNLPEKSSGILTVDNSSISAEKLVAEKLVAEKAAAEAVSVPKYDDSSIEMSFSEPEIVNMPQIKVKTPERISVLTAGNPEAPTDAFANSDRKPYVKIPVKTASENSDNLSLNSNVASSPTNPSKNALSDSEIVPVQRINLEACRGVQLNTAMEPKEIFVTDESICVCLHKSGTQTMLIGRQPGTTMITFNFGDNQYAPVIYRVEVKQTAQYADTVNLLKLIQDHVNSQYSEEGFRLTFIGQRLIVQGAVESLGQKEEVMQFVRQLLDEYSVKMGGSPNFGLVSLLKEPGQGRGFDSSLSAFAANRNADATERRGANKVERLQLGLFAGIELSGTDEIESVFISDPDVCDYVLGSDNKLTLVGRGVGSAQVNISYAFSGMPARQLEVQVKSWDTFGSQKQELLNLLQERVSSLFPETPMRISIVDDRIYIKCRAENRQESEELIVVARRVVQSLLRSMAKSTPYWSNREFQIIPQIKFPGSMTYVTVDSGTTAGTSGGASRELGLRSNGGYSADGNRQAVPVLPPPVENLSRVRKNAPDFNVNGPVGHNSTNDF